MKKSTLLLTLASIALPTYAQTSPAPVQERDPLQNEASMPNINQKNLKEDLLRKQRLSEQNAMAQENQANGNSVARFTGKQLAENPALLERLFLEALVNPNKAVLPVYIKIYESVPNADLSLIDWGKAILEREEDLNKSVASYRKLISDFPENNFIRYQLAETLFYNQEYEAAKTQFERLRASTKNAQDIAVFDKYIEVIDSKENWNFSFSTTFLNDKNLANSAKQGTKMAVGSGEVTYNTPRQTGQGLGLSVGADKRWSLSNGKYVAFDSSMSSRYYWDNKKYNDLIGHIGLGYGYSDARFNVQVTPYINKRWYGGGLNGGDSLKQYTDTYGASLSMGYWLNQNFKYSALYNFGYERYRKEVDKLNYNGAVHSLTNSLMFIPSSTQFWSISLDLTKKYAADRSNAYNRIGTRLTWGQEWPLGITTSTTLGYAKRHYLEQSFIGMKQRNNEYSASVSLWHKQFHYAGFTPKVTWSYSKTKSNMAIYSYDKNQVFIEVGKSF